LATYIINSQPNFKALTTEMRALTLQQKIMIAELLLLFIIPFLPNSVLLLTDNLIVRTILMGFVLASSLYGPYVLLLSFIVVLAIFGLRNNIKINRIVPPSVSSLPDISVENKIEPVPVQEASLEKPIERSYEFGPQDDTGDNSFAPVDISINQKVVMPSVKPDGMAGGLFPNPP